MEDPYEDEEEYEDWFNPFPMIVYAKQKTSVHLSSITHRL